jgi:hypothetical protein
MNAKKRKLEMLEERRSEYLRSLSLSKELQQEVY